MAIVCQVCSKEPAKYRCPQCSLQSCSLACSKTHKTSCSPELPEPKPEAAVTSLPKQNDSSATAGRQNAPDSSQPNISPSQQNDSKSFSDLENSPQLQELLKRFPTFRTRLREIHQVTLEEAWVDTMPAFSGRGRGRGRGGPSNRGGTRSRGPWTPEKGFNRGLGKVKKWRQSCDGEGPSMLGISGAEDEAFRQFIWLLLQDDKDPET